MAAMTRRGTVTGPLKAAAKTAAVGANMGAVNVEDEPVGMAVDIGTLVAGTDAAPPHAEIPARIATSAKAEINRGHRYISKFYQKPTRIHPLPPLVAGQSRLILSDSDKGHCEDGAPLVVPAKAGTDLQDYRASVERLAGLTLDTSGTGQIRLDLGGAVALTLDDSAVTTSGAVHPAFLGSLAGTGDSVAGSNFSLSTGAGSNASSSGAGDVGGTFDITVGAGSDGNTTGAGGAGGPFTLTSGAGGTALGCANAGAGGAITIVSGAGGANSSSNCSTGGASGAVSILTGVGSASNAACDAGGASGNLTIGTGRGGSGATGCSGAGGTVRLQIGRAGACWGRVAGRDGELLV